MTTSASTLGATKQRVNLQKNFVTALMDAVDRGIGTLVGALLAVIFGLGMWLPLGWAGLLEGGHEASGIGCHPGADFPLQHGGGIGTGQGRPAAAAGGGVARAPSSRACGRRSPSSGTRTGSRSSWCR